VARIREYSHDYLEEFPIELETNISENIPTFRISHEIYRNVFMIVKEVLQNVVKHASATRVWLTITLDENFRLEICDNGKGFDVGKQISGNGLKNLKNRSNSINALLSLNSSPGKGSSLILELKDLKANELLLK
jgi:signal transduction histidine kinase